jgi:hypothetical protein
MRIIASGIFLARKYNKTTIIHWNNTPGLSADFCHLFKTQMPPHTSIVENRNWLYNIDNTRQYVIRYPLLRSRCRVIYNYNRYANGNFSEKSCLLTGKDYMLIGCNSVDEHYNLHELFVPTDNIQNRINQIISQYSSTKTIGIHIRRTDNSQSIRRSPIEAFIKKIDEEISHDENVRFYLASDDDEVKQKFTRLYPDHIITHTDKLERNSLEGMVFAVTELFCLSKTQKIIGSDYSSYSNIAAELGDIPVEFAR